jgi:putative LysE/RhtB family amino acid efflux pump
MSAAFATGLGLGFLVGAQVGPIWLLCARSVLRGTFAVGVAIGAGAAAIDALYAALGALGAAALLEIDPLRIALGLTGAAVLAWLGARTIWSAFRVRLGGETAEEVASPRRAFLTSLGATASNPLTIASWAAVFSAASTGQLVDSPSSAAALVVGVGLGTLTWFTTLSAALAFGRRRVGSRVLTAVDIVAGSALLGFSGLLAFRTLEGES